MNANLLVEGEGENKRFRLTNPLLIDMIRLILWRDEVTTKKKARAIQRIIDRKLEKLNVEEEKCLKNLSREFNFKISAW
jgi:hypothetical protein